MDSFIPANRTFVTFRRRGQRMLSAAAIVGSAFFASPGAAVNFAQTVGGPELAPLASLARNDAGAVYALVSDRIYKTIDSGLSWSPLATAPAAKAHRIALVGSALFAGTAQGVFRSTDDGASWEAFNGSGGTELVPNGAVAVFGGGDVIYAQLFDANAIGRLYRSSPAAAAWTEVTPPGIGGNGVDLIVMAGNRACAMVTNAGVRYSDDDGATWASASGVSGSFSAMAVAPTDANRVYVANSSGGVSRSVNACQAFASAGFAFSGQSGIAARGLGPDGMQVYVGGSDGTIRAATDSGSGAMAFSDARSGSLPNTVGAEPLSFIATGGGVLAGISGQGAHFRASGDWQARNSGLKGATVTTLADLGAAGSFAVGAGGVQFTPDGGASYAPRNTGLTERGTRALARFGNTLVAGVFTPGAGSQPPGAFVSTDDGANWSQLQAASGLPTGVQVDSLVTDGSAFYAGVSFASSFADRGVYKSADGLTWTKLMNGLPGNPSLRNLAVKGTKLFAYVGGSGLYRSTDAGTSWQLVLSNTSSGKVFASSGAVFASFNGGVWRSTDDGDSFSLTAGFALSRFGIELLALAEDAAGTLYLGDEHAGLSISKDGGATWTPDSDGLHRSGTCVERINALLVKDGKVYAGQGEGGGVMVADAIGSGTPGDGIGCTTQVDTFPGAFTFTASNNATPAAELRSNVIVVSGLGAGVTTGIRVDNGEYSASSPGGTCEGPFTSAPGTVQGGTRVCVRHTAAATGETATNTRLHIGDATTLGEQSATFTSRTGLVYSGRADEINTSFGNGGFATASGVSQADDLKILSDGRIVAASGIPGFDNAFALTMYTATGALDTGFGNGGKAVVQIPAGGESISSVVPLSNGKFMLVGTSFGSNNLIALVRLNANGSVDTAFGSNGIVTFDVRPSTPSNFESVGDATLMPDGAIVVVGAIGTSGAGSQFFAVRFSQDGVADTTFGADSPLFADGVANSGSLGTSSPSTGAMAVQSNGAIIVAGIFNGTGTITGGAMRFLADGTADSTWGSAGKATVPTTSGIQDAIVLAGDKIVLIGRATVGNAFRPMVARLNADGTLDTSFAGDGVFSLDTIGGALTSGELLPDGDIAAIGMATAPDGTSQLLHVRLNPDGTLDNAFGPNGQGYVFRGPVNGNAVTGVSSALRSDGGLLVGGVFGTTQGLFVFDGTGTTPPPPDTTPEAFTFTAVTGVEPLSEQTSSAITVAGINAAAPVSVTGGSYSVNGGAFASAAGSVVNGDSLRVRHTASMAFSTATTTALTIGGVSATFTSTTRAETPAPDTTPNAFTLRDQSGVPTNSTVTSAPITVAGINVPTAISVGSGGGYSVNGGAFTQDAGTVNAGDKVRVRHSAAATAGQSTDTVLTIGGVNDTFSSTTAETTPGSANGNGTWTLPGSSFGNLTLGTSAGALASPVRIPAPNVAPTGFNYPAGFFAFRITGLPNGGQANVTVQLPPSARTPSAWMQCTNGDCQPFANAVISGTTLTLTLTDGGPGDADGLANGEIDDPGAPAYSTPAAATSDDDKKFLGAFDAWTLMLLAPLFAMRRRRV